MTPPNPPLDLILCVDDEPAVLTGLERLLKRRFQPVLASSAAAAMEQIEQGTDFSVVLSDLKMPGTNGIEFLTKVREIKPEISRILFTGRADMQMAAAAINEGQIFRFLTKPSPSDRILGAIEAGVEQHRLMVSERVLLQQTLRGSVKALVDILALAQPEAFGRATRLKHMVTTLADLMGIKDVWELEIAALLSQIGAVSLRSEVLNQLHRGEDLAAEDAERAAAIPSVSAELIEGIPRLERVRSILRHQSRVFRRQQQGPHGEPTPVEARLLEAVIEYDNLIGRGYSPAEALNRLGARGEDYDRRVLECLSQALGTAADLRISSMRLEEVPEGSLFVDDIYAEDGTLLIARGQEASAGLVNRIRTFWVDLVLKGPAMVVVPGDRLASPPRGLLVP